MTESKTGWNEAVLDVLHKINTKLRVSSPVRGEWLVDPDSELVVF